MTDGTDLATEPGAGLLREARIDLDAFADNLRLLIAKYGEIALDARADAHGHSLALIVPVAMQLGVQGYVSSGRSALPPADKLHIVSAAVLEGQSGTMSSRREDSSCQCSAVGSSLSLNFAPW